MLVINIFSPSHNLFNPFKDNFYHLHQLCLTSANTFASDKRKFLLCGKELSLYHTIPTFNDHKEEGFGKLCGKMRKCSPFATVFSTLSRRKVIILEMYNLSSANAFNLVTFKILLFGKGLNPIHTT